MSDLTAEEKMVAIRTEATEAADKLNEVLCYAGSHEFLSPSERHTITTIKEKINERVEFMNRLGNELF